MALLHSPFEWPIRPDNNGSWWQDPVEDLFDALINPDSYHHSSDSEAQRQPSDDLSYLFDSTSGSETIDTSPTLDSDFAPRQAYGFVGHDAQSSTLLRCRPPPAHSVQLASKGRIVSSDSDLLSLQIALTRHLESISRSANSANPVTCPSTPISVPAKRVVTPPVLREQLAHSPIHSEDRPQSEHPRSLAPKMMSPSIYKDALWPRRLGASTATNSHLNFELPFGKEEAHPASSPKTPRFKTESFTDYPFAHDGLAKSGGSSSGFPPHPYANEIEPLSPFSNTFQGLPHPNTPVASPTFKNSFERGNGEIGASGLPLGTTRENLDMLLTPPPTGQLSSACWTGASFSEHLLGSSASSAFGVGVSLTCDDKAETWSWSPPHSGQSTAGTNSGPAILSGLGVSAIGRDISGPISPAAANSLITAMGQHHQHQPDVASFSTAGLLSAPPTPGSIPPNLVMQRPEHSPLVQDAGSGYFPPQPTGSAAGPTSASASSCSLQLRYLQRLQQRQQQRREQARMYHRPHHQRHHTVAAPVSTVQMPQLVYRNARTASISPPPSSGSRTHKRSRSAHHNRRKSSGNSSVREASRQAPVAVDFVNFTPEDSRKILTGVAPSGSSKTKARREKEAAERRRKLSEAAKRAVLEAGGDLGPLEREGLLILGEGL